MRKHYNTLGVNLNASQKEIREAYLRLVKAWHPDLYQHDPSLQRRSEEELKKINSAWEYFRSKSGETESEHTFTFDRTQPNADFDPSLPKQKQVLTVFASKRELVKLFPGWLLFSWFPLTVFLDGWDSIVQFFQDNSLLIIIPNVFIFVLCLMFSLLASLTIPILIFRPQLVVNQAGLYCGMIPGFFVNWKSISSVSFDKKASEKWLYITFTDEYLERVSYLRRLWLKIGLALSGYHYGISLKLAQTSAEEIESFIKRHTI